MSEDQDAKEKGSEPGQLDSVGADQERRPEFEVVGELSEDELADAVADWIVDLIDNDLIDDAGALNADSEVDDNLSS